MLYTLAAYPQNHLVVVTLAPPAGTRSETVHNFRMIAEYTAHFVRRHAGPTFRIFDFSMLDLPFTNLAIFLVEGAKRRPGSLTDGCVQNFAVGCTETMIADVYEVQQQGAGLDLTVLPTMDDALAHIESVLRPQKLISTLSWN